MYLRAHHAVQSVHIHEHGLEDVHLVGLGGRAVLGLGIGAVSQHQHGLQTHSREGHPVIYATLSPFLWNEICVKPP